MKALTLLNSHLDKVVAVGSPDSFINREIMLGGKAYPRAKAERVYAKLTAPKKPGLFYNANRVRGEIHPDGEVLFQTAYPELGDHFDPDGWSLRSPEELGMTRTSPKPVRGMVGMNKTLDALTTSREGAGLYYNVPLSHHRADAYTKRGFAAATDSNIQFLDNRRFRDNPVIAELLATQDAKQFGVDATARLRQDLYNRHPQIQATVEQNIDPRSLVDSMSDDQLNAWLSDLLIDVGLE